MEGINTASEPMKEYSGRFYEEYHLELTQIGKHGGTFRKRL